ncbi:hypothetical protein GCM10007094_23940 [Pseudovibrio japonicus]|uniref:Uncharacterized protein n=1 Tax=Pseudovibrio japonicus TaxID=366534 RepID=A0ABQ3EDH6_9HYPH|nr:hypothetical protein [Pseudovibrio japonicus]GHB34096.1 hypothetical protein GCM10007094_23940 [Pseudovibrio japonicus]
MSVIDDFGRSAQVNAELAGNVNSWLDQAKEVNAALEQIFGADRAQWLQDLQTNQIPRMKISRRFDDSNPTLAYPAGTGLDDGAITHSTSYESAFPDQETTLFLIWSTLLKVTDPEDNKAVISVWLADDANKAVTNVEQVGIEDSATGASYYWSTVTASGKVSKSSDQSDVEITQRIYMSNANSDSAATCFVDRMDLTIIEVVND